MPRPPRVTVFIPTCNRAHYVGVAVRSALAQRFDSLEVLVLDDGSTDDTLERLAGIDDPRLRVERNPANLGIPATHNRGLELARGEYFAMLDDDEWAPPQRLSRQVGFLERHPDCAAVGSSYQLMDSTGGSAGQIRLNPRQPAEVAATLLFRCAIHKPTVTARTATLREYGFNANQRLFEDHALWARMARTHQLVNLPEVLGTYRKHGGQTTAAPALAQHEKQLVCGRQLQALGLTPTAEELRRHVWLAAHNLAPPELLRDPEFLRWAHDWLEGLLRANGAARCYEPAALRAAVGLVWRGLALRAAHSGAAVPAATGTLRWPVARARARRWWQRRVRTAWLKRLAPLPA